MENYLLEKMVKLGCMTDHAVDTLAPPYIQNRLANTSFNIFSIDVSCVRTYFIKFNIIYIDKFLCSVPNNSLLKDLTILLKCNSLFFQIR